MGASVLYYSMTDNDKPRRGVRVPMGTLQAPSADILELRGIAASLEADVIPAHTIRERAKRRFDRHLDTLDEIASGDATTIVATKAGPVSVGPSASDRVRAIDTLGKYGLGSAGGVDPDIIRRKLLATIDVIRSQLDAGVADAILQELRGIWE